MPGRLRQRLTSLGYLLTSSRDSSPRRSVPAQRRPRRGEGEHRSDLCVVGRQEHARGYRRVRAAIPQERRAPSVAAVLARKPKRLASAATVVS